MENNKKKFLHKSLFQKQILMIRNKKLQKYFLNLLEIKVLILKFVFFVILSTLIFTSSFGIRQYFIDFNPNEIVLNPGIAFSQFDDANSAVVYLIQSIPVILAFLAIIFLPNPYICIGLITLLLGGLTNIIDRSLGGEIEINNHLVSLKNAVIDYIPIGNTKANLPDIYIITGASLSGLITLIYIWKHIKHDDNMI